MAHIHFVCVQRPLQAQLARLVISILIQFFTFTLPKNAPPPARDDINTKGARMTQAPGKLALSPTTRGGGPPAKPQPRPPPPPSGKSLLVLVVRDLALTKQRSCCSLHARRT